MLTGLLPATEGESFVFGRPVAPDAVESRARLGYMSQSFSLYVELSVRQNLELHGRLFGLAEPRLGERIAELIDRFDLADARDPLAGALPLGVRQRLSLAVAVIHEPELLILDEPTSGVDPMARDRFWELLGDLSRQRRVTIFVSTHFLNEGARCDRIALMNEGRVLACDAPAALVAAQGVATLEEAFVAYIRADAPGTAIEAAPAATPPPAAVRSGVRRFDARRLFAYAWREWIELRRDPIRLAMCFYAPIVLLVVLGYGVSLDVDRLPWAALDRDRTPESRSHLEHYAASRYFEEHGALASEAELERRLVSGELSVAIEVPAGFGRALVAGDRPEVGVWIDGAMPFRAETARGYLAGIEESWVRGFAAPRGAAPADAAEITTRFRYNQDLRSVDSIVPGVLALVLVVVPTMLMAVAVVREKELGSITNFHATPVRRIEFLLGKQGPYVAVSLVSFVTLTIVTLALFRVPLKGSFAAVAFGAALYVWATTGLGLLVSAFTRTQIAAIVAATVLTTLPTVQFSGLIAPVSSLTGAAAVMGRGFPASWFNRISVGVFTKALAAADLWEAYAALAAFGFALTAASLLFLRKQVP
jgi:ribosome-dependent ATPase